MQRRIALGVALAAVALVAVFGVSSAFAGKTAPMIVKVTAIDFSFKLSAKSVPAGKRVTFVVTNKGKAVHDFDFTGGKGTPYIQPGKSYKFTTTLKKGKWPYSCTVPRHAELGMVGALIAK